MVAVLYLLAAAAPPTGRTPTFKWSQSPTELELDIRVTCDQSTKRVTAVEDAFNFSCTGARGSAQAGAQYSLSIKLREDVHADVHCTQKRGAQLPTEFCRLSKLDPHEFDRLTQDPFAFPAHMTYNCALQDLNRRLQLILSASTIARAHAAGKRGEGVADEDDGDDFPSTAMLAPKKLGAIHPVTSPEVFRNDTWSLARAVITSSVRVDSNG